MTAKEKAVIKSDHLRIEGIHDTYNNFFVSFTTKSKQKRKYNKTGHALLEGIVDWVSKQPKGCSRVVWCGDESFNASLLVLIEHKKPDIYMGTSVIHVTQTSSQPMVFFLYPNHRKNLGDALDDIEEEAEIIQDTEDEYIRTRARNLASWRY